MPVSPLARRRRSALLLVSTAAGSNTPTSKQIVIRLTNPVDVERGALFQGSVLIVDSDDFDPKLLDDFEQGAFLWDTDGPASIEAVRREVALLGETVPFGSDLVFEASSIPAFRLHVEICEDLWAPIPPSTFGALAGATVLANLSASNITMGKTDYRRLLCAAARLGATRLIDNVRLALNPVSDWGMLADG